MNTETNTAVRRRKCSEGDDTSSISRSSRIYSDAIRLGDVLSFLKDVQKFLDRLDHEPNLSHDCLDLKKSLASRIEFYTKLGSRPESGVYYNGRSDCDSFELPPPPPDSLPPTIRRNQTSPLPPPPPSTCPLSLSSDDSLGYGTGGEPSSLDMSEDHHDESIDIYSDDIQENYDRVQTPPLVLDPSLRTPPGTPPAKTSTPKGKRSSGFQTQKFENIPENPNEVEEEVYDAMEDEDINSKPLPSCNFVGTSARILNSLADHKGWLWKKESMFKTSRFWALIYMSKLFLYNEAQDEMKKEAFNLEYATLKRHKKGVKFIVHISGTYKNKNAKQEFQTENSSMTEVWINALENAIATAGKLLKPIPKTKQGITCSDSSVNEESSISSANNDSIEEDEQYDAIETSFELVKEPEEDEEYDLVEINRSGEYQDYDVPKPKGTIVSPIKDRRSNSSARSVQYGEDNQIDAKNKAFKKQSSLPGVQLEDKINKSQIKDQIMKKQSSVPSMRISQETIDSKERSVKPTLTPRKHIDLQIPIVQSSPHTKQIDPPTLPKRGPPPLPSPRKLSPSYPKPNLTEEIHQESEAGVRRKLFLENEDITFDTKNKDESKPVKPHAQFSSKTLQKPKKDKTENKVSEAFRPRNKSESKPAMSNELAAILEKRRNNLQIPSTKPEIPVRPKNLTLTDSPTKDACPPYSKVNKTGSKFVQDSTKPKNVSQQSPIQETSQSESNNRHIPKSFLHSFVNAGDMDSPLNKGW